MSDWTGMGPNAPAPKLDPNCQCICHTQPGVMHFAACCREPAMTDDTPPVLYISADTSDLTTRYKATPRMHMGADAWIPRDLLIDVAASLAAAISLLERGGKAAKKAAPSDRMFDQMLKDYRASLNSARAALAALPAADEGEQEEGE